jgi:hypothetical protein
MWTLTLMIQGQAPAILQYEKGDKAEAAFALAASAIDGENQGALSFRDGFGRAFSIMGAHIQAAMLEDLENARKGDIAIQLLNARAQANLNRMAAADPAVRAAQAGAQLIAPMNGFPRQ